QPKPNSKTVAILDPEHLFDQADRLVAPPPAGPPRQADVRRAISAAYYAVFHGTLAAVADHLRARASGAPASTRSCTGASTIGRSGRYARRRPDRPDKDTRRTSRTGHSAPASRTSRRRSWNYRKSDTARTMTRSFASRHQTQNWRSAPLAQRSNGSKPLAPA